MLPRISVFPKCYFDELTAGRMSFAGWIRAAAALGGEGLGHYDGFFRSLLPADVDPIARALDETEQISRRGSRRHLRPAATSSARAASTLRSSSGRR